MLTLRFARDLVGCCIDNRAEDRIESRADNRVKDRA